MEVTLLSRNRPVARKVEKDHYWYDHLNKIMYHGRGGRLEYKYDPDTRRSIPNVVDCEELVLQNDYPLLKQWVKEKQSELGLSILSDSGKNIVLWVDAIRFDELDRELVASGITVDYDENVLRRELKEAEKEYGKLNSHGRRRRSVPR